MPELLDQGTLKQLAAEARANPDRSRLVYDTALPGFCVRLRSGRLEFCYAYRRHGRERRMSLGRFGALTLEQGRDAARSAYAKVKEGGDPLGEREADRVRRQTFGDVAAAYLEDLAERADGGAVRGRHSTLAEFRGLLRRHILPRLGGKEIEAVTLADVEDLHRALKATPATANRALTVASAVLRFAERLRLRPPGSNPCGLVTRWREKPKAPRLSLAELRRLGEAIRAAEAEGEDPAALLAVKLLAVTGCRRSEIIGHALKIRRPDGGGGLRWCDFDPEARTLFLRDAKSGDRVCPLGTVAAQILMAARPEGAEDGAPICPGALPGAPLAVLEKPWSRLLQRAEIAPCGVHSLRRTFASVAADVGLGEYLIGALLGHARSGSVTSRYVAPGADPLRQAAELVASEIGAALGLDLREPGKLLVMAGREAGR